MDAIPDVVMNGLTVCGGLLPAVGMAMLMKMLWDKKICMFYFLGFVLSAYMNLPLIAIAVIGVIVAISIGMNDYKINQLSMQRVAAPAGNQSSEFDEEEEEFFLMSNLTKSIPADERKMLKKAFWRSFTLYAAVSPAKQGASGFCYALMPFINKFYKNDEEGKKEALVRSMSYFNTTITCSTFIMGLVASMEKKNSEQKDFDANSINAVKSSLMGPLAGIGDSIFWGVLRVIAAGIAVGLGMTGNILAPIVFLLLFNIPSLLVKYYGTFLGYKLGSEYIQKVYASGLMNILTKAASTVGLIMVGGMTASMVTFNSTFELSMQGESILNLQSMLDQIFHWNRSAGTDSFVLLPSEKKNVSITVLIIGVIVLGIVLSLLGIA